MFQIDERLDYARLQQFATQAAHLTDEERALMEQHFAGEETEDYYFGLIAGLAGAYTILSSGEMASRTETTSIGHLLAFAADKLAQRGV